MPHPVVDDAGADDRMVPADGGPYAEGQATRAERHAVVAVVTAAEHVPVHDDVAEDPVVAAGRNRAG
jgi:hypothetical protein